MFTCLWHNVPLAAWKPPKRAFLRPKQALFDMDECPETPPCGTVDGGGDAVSQRLNRRKGTNNN